MQVELVRAARAGRLRKIEDALRALRALAPRCVLVLSESDVRRQMRTHLLLQCGTRPMRNAREGQPTRQRHDLDVVVQDAEPIRDPREQAAPPKTDVLGHDVVIAAGRHVWKRLLGADKEPQTAVLHAIESRSPKTRRVSTKAG
jgi:hypothetical protein